MFPHDATTVKWINLARKALPIEGLPARVCYLGFGERKAFGMAVNRLIRAGEVKGPVGFSRDNLDSGSIVNPTFESEKMLDGGDLISDWPYLNALLNASAMCDLIAIQANYSMGEAVHTGVTMIADGSEEADLRLEAALTVDSGIGVIRHAQAGYEMARQVAQGKRPAHDRQHPGAALVEPAGDFRAGRRDGRPPRRAHAPKRTVVASCRKRLPPLPPTSSCGAALS